MGHIKSILLVLFLLFVASCEQTAFAKTAGTCMGQYRPLCPLKSHPACICHRQPNGFLDCSYMCIKEVNPHD